ncbi:MAG TPA: hypothetical protein VK436_11315 [Methanocella sp.]|nr:hypothetical protein [Methanocella sp.]
MTSQQPEKYYIASLDQYLALLKAEKVSDCFSGLQRLSDRDSFDDKIIVVRVNIAEQIRARYSTTKMAFYGANRDIEFTAQTTLDSVEN